MSVVSIVDYRENESSIRAVREAVFIAEQRVSREDEFDGKDTSCVHVLAVVDGQAVATGRLDLGSGGKIGRVAVLPEFRRRGVGTQVMKVLEQAGIQAGLTQVWFHAQLTAVSFYESLGYTAEGEVFSEAGIQHVKMLRRFG